MRTHFFDFIAIIPALALVNHGIALELVWVWVILMARFARAIDRLLGDGFVRRNIWALIEGAEEEITDRVLQRIIIRVQGDMDRANFSHGVAEAFIKNKLPFYNVFGRQHPIKGLFPVSHILSGWTRHWSVLKSALMMP